MRFTCAQRPPARIHARICFVDGDAGWNGAPALRAALGERLKQGPVAVLPSLGHADQPVVGVVRMPRWEDAVETRRRGGGLARALIAERCTSLALELPKDCLPAQVEPFLVGLAQGGYAWDRFQAIKAVRLAEVVLLTTPTGEWKALIDRVAVQVQAVEACRDLTNLPAADLGPDEFTVEARQAAKASGLRLRVLDENACAKLGMGCLLAVGRASPRRPRLLVLELPGKTDAKPLALCGKGVCFDTGGLNLKTAEGMALMRKDMGGAAAVLCALVAAARLGRPARTVRAYLPLVENAIGSKAFRPGDVLRAMDGTTIEIGNTDAEGRLILADAVAYARAQGAGRIVSVATLTGAALVALGRIHVPLIASDDALAGELLAAAQATGEKLWRLPLDHEHRALLKGQVAQLTNAPSGGEAGCITAGAFVAHFAKDTPFAHLDISPASWMPKPWDLGPIGATGTSVTTLARLACG